MPNFEKIHRTRRGWFWKLNRMLVSAFVFRRDGEAPVYNRETPSEGIERITRKGAAEELTYRASNKFQIQLVFEFWKAILNQGRQATPEDERFVERFVADTISAMIQDEDREGYWEYYRNLNADDIKFRNVCVLLKARTKPDLRLQLANAVYKFAYSRGFDKQKMHDLDFYCQMMELPSDKIRQADFAGKNWKDVY